MSENQNNENKVYSHRVVEFVTVAREYCLLLENTQKYTKADFLKVVSQMLPLLYLKASMLPSFEQLLDEDPQDYVDEYTYEQIRIAIRRKLTRHDDYLEVFKDDMQLSETPVVANISEDLADIYQDLFNFCEAYRIGVDEIMNDALYKVSDQFRNYWGQRLCNAQRAVHSTLYGPDDLDDEKPLDDQALARNESPDLDDSDNWSFPTLDR